MTFDGLKKLYLLDQDLRRGKKLTRPLVMLLLQIGYLQKGGVVHTSDLFLTIARGESNKTFFQKINELAENGLITKHEPAKGRNYFELTQKGQEFSDYYLKEAANYH